MLWVCSVCYFIDFFFSIVDQFSTDLEETVELAESSLATASMTKLSDWELSVAGKMFVTLSLSKS